MATRGDGTAPQLNGTRYFSFEELTRCTDNFSKNNEIGGSLYGKFYKGCCTDGVLVAIKRATKGAFLDTKQFQLEIEVLSRVHHKNIVSLVVFCCERGERLLVYEYISKGTLRDNLDGKHGMHLDWKRRLQIALDSARGLAYLHELAYRPIIHQDVKSINILLNENLNAKVTEFAFSKIVFEKQERHLSFQVRGTSAHEESGITDTVGYLDPEYRKTGLVSAKSDVYSFGMVMLELVTARLPSDIYEELDRAVDQNEQEYYGLREIIDPTIANQVRNDDLRKFVQLALKCLEYSASDRPSMSEIVKEIDIIMHHGASETNNNC